MSKRMVIVWVFVAIGAILVFTHLSPLQAGAPIFTAPNPAPHVVPSLREWQGSTGTFELTTSTRIIVDPAYMQQLQETATLFQTDLFTLTQLSLPVISSSDPGEGNFFLTLRTTDRGLGNEGYLLQTQDSVRISAHTHTGIFYGTRTILQILRQDSTHTHIAKGTARDYPSYPVRGFVLDVGRKFFSLSFLKNYIRYMSWYKMNNFQLHFNDNELYVGDSPDWQTKYAAFRLNSPRFKGLAAKDGSYTRQDIQELLQVARAYEVTITPEIDTPAHSLALTQYRPDLVSKQYAKDLLDLSNPDTYTFMNAIWDEFLPWFDTSEVHIGADEYDPRDANMYRQYINTYASYLQHKGKTVRIWGSLTAIPGSVKVDTNIVMEVWNNRWSNPVDMAAQGYSIINTNDNLLYIVPKAGYYHDYLDTHLLYERWEPYIFDLNNPRYNLKPGDPRLLGGMFALWNDKLGGVVSEAEVYDRIKAPTWTLGQKLWSGSTAHMPYTDFSHLVQSIGDAL